MNRGSDLHILLLAAGISSRMGKPNKLLMQSQGKPIVRHVAEQLLLSEVGPITVVTGCDAKQVEHALVGLNVSFCFNPNYSTGQMSSVRQGFCGLEEKHADVMIALADMPGLHCDDYRTVVQAFLQHNCDKIIVPHYGTERGNPIVIPHRFSKEIITGSLKAGCKKLVASRPRDVFKLSVSNAAHITDIDIPEDYKNFRQKSSVSSA